MLGVFVAGFVILRPDAGVPGTPPIGGRGHCGMRIFKPCPLLRISILTGIVVLAVFIIMLLLAVANESPEFTDHVTAGLAVLKVDVARRIIEQADRVPCSNTLYRTRRCSASKVLRAFT